MTTTKSELRRSARCEGLRDRVDAEMARPVSSSREGLRPLCC
jgi:hypothetical protein